MLGNHDADEADGADEADDAAESGAAGGASDLEPSRRGVLKVGGVAATTLATGGGVAAAALGGSAGEAAAAPAATTDVTLRINGEARQVTVESRVTLLDALRERLGLTGTKKGCDRGECGACTVLIEDQRVKSCLTLAVMEDGRKITTIEGLAEGDQLHPVQAAFIQRDAFQCGFCTPGQIMSAVACVNEGHTGSGREIREWMSGNLCRCGCYPNIVDAVQDAAKGATR